MKKLFSIFLIAGVCQAFGMNPERLFQMAINGQSEFGGRATSVLDRKMQNIHAFITLRENYVDDGYAGKGWDHSDPKLGDIYWIMEEASWLRFAYDKKELKNNCLLFTKFLENKYRLESSPKIIDDLINFQIFLLTTREDSKGTKSAGFSHNWKDYFVNKSELKDSKRSYIYQNKNSEQDPIEWAYKTIWFGRYSIKYKLHPEFLDEVKNKIEISSNS